ncbi:MAG: hypothetical protein IJS31_07170 [Oscillospiraceae bacterium]|nr:hypothetical protein [Oscillospiraceae bacterium]
MSKFMDRAAFEQTDSFGIDAPNDKIKQYVGWPKGWAVFRLAKEILKD